MVLIHNYDDLTIKKIIIKKSCIHSEKYKTKDIKYKIKEPDGRTYKYEDIFFQTPFLMLRYTPQMYEGNVDSKITLDVPLKVSKTKDKDKDNENQCDIDSEEFCLIIKKIHKSLKTKLIKKESEKINALQNFEEKVSKKKLREKYIECLKTKDDILDENYKNYNLKVKIHSLNGKPYIRIYNSKRKLCKEQKFKHNTLTRLILHLESIWYFEDTYGFNWYAVQAEIKLPNIPPNYFFYNENKLPNYDEKEKEKENNNNSIPEKYLKMIKMGVPKPAVELRMRQDGIMIPGCIPPPIPPPPPPPPLGTLTNVKLKKVTVEKKETTVKEQTNTDCRIPSLSQLQEQLSKLRKVEKKGN